MILILADEFDSHADAVQHNLVTMGGVFFRLNLNVEALLKTTIGFDGRTWIIRQGGCEVSAAQFETVWARRLTVSQTLEQQAETESAGSRLWRSEWNRALYGLYASLREAAWLNPIQASALADNKFYQWGIAQDVGFNVPPTMMSNDRRELSAFAHQHGSAALKFLSQDMYQLDDGTFAGIYVNRLTARDIRRFGGSEENPVVLQAYKDKAFEVRYTVVDENHFPCAIYSQESERASVDWRRYDIPRTPHAAIEAPPEIADKIRVLMDRLGLRYGALDFIVDNAGLWWYLEVNSAGQWLWIEDLAGLPISASLARTLMKAEEGFAR